MYLGQRPLAHYLRVSAKTIAVILQAFIVKHAVKKIIAYSGLYGFY
jgi:hypothetical protein